MPTQPDGVRGSAADDPSSTASSPRHARRGLPSPRGLWLMVTGLAVTLAPLALAVGITATATEPSPAVRAGEARLVSAVELERDYGIKVKLIAVTAEGGVVDLRFTVTDREKAAHLLHDAGALPELFVEASGAVLRSPKPMAHKMTVRDGASYFLLYPNSGGVVQAGSEVSVVIDDVRLTAIHAQS